MIAMRVPRRCVSHPRRMVKSLSIPLHGTDTAAAVGPRGTLEVARAFRLDGTSH